MIHPLSIDEEMDLMRQVAQGDETATRKLVADYLDYVITLAFRILGNRHDSEEIAQDVFIKLFKQAETWVPKARVSTWLYRVTYNAAIDCLRSRRRHGAYELNEFLMGIDDKKIDFEFEEAAYLEKLEEAMSRLSTSYRAALTIFYFQEKRTREAAEIMNLKEDAFESLLRRARKKLRDILEETDTQGGKNESEKGKENPITRTGRTDAYQIPLLY